MPDISAVATVAQFLEPGVGDNQKKNLLCHGNVASRP
jgi:hypothetical protein